MTHRGMTVELPYH